MTEYERAAEASICQQRLTAPLQREDCLVPLHPGISSHAIFVAPSTEHVRKAARRERWQVQRRAGAMTLSSGVLFTKSQSFEPVWNRRNIRGAQKGGSTSDGCQMLTIDVSCETRPDSLCHGSGATGDEGPDWPGTQRGRVLEMLPPAELQH